MTASEIESLADHIALMLLERQDGKTYCESVNSYDSETGKLHRHDNREYLRFSVARVIRRWVRKFGSED